MGMIDTLRKIFKDSNNRPLIPEDDSGKKEILATQIVNLVDKIKKINSFDSCLWNLRNVTTYSLKSKSLGELQTLHSSLTNRLEKLTNLKTKANQTYQDLEAAKWTGEKPTHLSNHDFDRLQNDYSR